VDAFQSFPSFDEQLPFLNQFILGLVEAYQAGQITSWDELDDRVKGFFTSERMEQICSIAPTWKTMASYLEGVTLTHVMCVFLGMYMTPEYLSLSPEHQGMMKWVTLFHDIEKAPLPNKRDHLHAFRSAVNAARTLPRLGFPVTSEYDSRITEWDQFTRSAIAQLENSPDDIPDNDKLPIILSGINAMFGQNTPAALIIQTVLFHLSINTDLWPPPNPLTNAEMKKYFNKELAALLLIMMLGDNDGWTLFYPDARENQRDDIIDKFEKIEKLISS
jgi:hypothetical protein